MTKPYPSQIIRGGVDDDSSADDAVDAVQRYLSVRQLNPENVSHYYRNHRN
jgi:hypothetical protein